MSWIRHVPGLRTAGVRAKSVWRSLSQRQLFPPGHYYSPTPDGNWIRCNRERLFRTEARELPGVDLRETEQKRLLVELAAFHREFDVADEPSDDRRYFANNTFFGRASAFNLYAMLRRFEPQRVIEVGSGFSSALMLDTNDRHFAGRTSLTFIEPHSERLRSLVRSDESGGVEILEKPVQDVPASSFEELEAGDVLFVDSSHVTKVGSDVNHLLFEVLPRLQPGVLIHFHDVTWPFEYPERWLAEGRFWNEAYILRAFLQFNPAFEILLFDDYLAHCHAGLLRQTLPAFPGGLGASLWLRRVE